MDKEEIKAAYDSGLGMILYDTFDLLEKADDKHAGKQVKFRSKKYYEGYIDALEAVQKCIKTRSLRRDK